MAYSREDVAAELKKRGINPDTGQSIAQMAPMQTAQQNNTGAELELRRRGIDPTGGLVGQLRSRGLFGYPIGVAKDIAMTPVRAAEVGVGAGQELQRLELNIPGVKPALAKIATLMTRPLGGRGVTAEQVQPAEAISPESPQAQIGKLLADVVAYGAPIGAAGRLGLGAVGRVAAGLGTGAALAPPEQRGMGALEMGGAALAPELAVGATRLATQFPKMDVVFRNRLAQRLINGWNRAKGNANQLYDTAFQGTEGITPQLGKDTVSNFKELDQKFPQPRSDVQEALKTYKNNKTLNNLHLLKSDLGKELDFYEVKRAKGTITQTEKTESKLISETMKNIDKSLKRNFDGLDPHKKAQYDLAQSYYKENVAPFKYKRHTAMIRALSPERDITNKLYTEIGGDSTEAAKVRNVLGLPRHHIEIARLIRNKYLSIPAAIGALYGIKRYF